MAVTRRYVKPLQIVATPEMARRTKAIAERENVSMAQIYRELIMAALPERERYSESRTH